MNFREWVNTVNTVSLSSLTNQGLWIMGSLAFTGLVWWLAWHDKPYIELAGGLLFAWTGKSAITAFSRYGKSTTAVPYVEAKERGKASATPQPATVHAEKVETVEVTAERPRA
jgi:hypothetical protein